MLVRDQRHRSARHGRRFWQAQIRFALGWTPCTRRRPRRAPSRTTSRPSTRSRRGSRARCRRTRSPSGSASRPARCRGCCAGSTSSACSSTSATAACRLTAEGRRVALRTLRNHRLLELLLVEMLDVPWDLVHERGRAARARALRRAGRADRGEARPPGVRPARRPDPERATSTSPSARRARSRTSTSARPSRSCASRTPTRRCCATCTERGIVPGVTLDGDRPPAVRRAAHRPPRRRRRTRSAASSPAAMRVA